MRIPDCRTDKDYNEKYLDQASKLIIAGFDECVEDHIDSFLANLEDHFPKDSFLGHALFTELPENLKDNYDYPYKEGGEKREIVTYADLLRQTALEYLEGERDEIITSMIDNMDDEMYDAIRKSVDGE